ncbi:sensor histidine kinase [Bifidobacterium cuniculi]|uniref:histidine kinase n=1 Tax=Bifidobacterium cuniculi TaxID=1688 RepID=A0A087AX59_9BIFI|nr:HAMP domain-containing sensor histidine kinase [Bifidobacterium cuniculi]KFI63359.1 sensor protein [Bifidobacterium cuniculi]
MNQPATGQASQDAAGRKAPRRSDVPLSVKLVSMIIVLLSVGAASISWAICTLVNNYMTKRTDDQLLQQASLVVNNVHELNEKANVSNSLITYYVELYDELNGQTTIMLQPVYKNDIISRPQLPEDGDLGQYQLGVPFTTPAIVDTAKATRQPDHSTLEMAHYPWRVVALQLDCRKSADGPMQHCGIIYIGLSMGNQIELVNKLTHFCAMVGISVVLLGGVLSALAVQHALSPLKRIEKTAAKIADGDLSQRVPYAQYNTEMGSLARSLNSMLARIERSFRQQQRTTEKMKRFVSDASHELRTPLAAIHGYAELYRMQRQAPDALERADDSIAHIEASSARMTLLVEDLLSLARLDEGHGIDMTQHINLGAVMRDCADDLHALDPERVIRTGIVGLNAAAPAPPRLEMVTGALPDVALVADGTRLHQIVTNIVGNIHRYTPADSPVELSLGVIGLDLDAGELDEMAPDGNSLQLILEAAARFRTTRQGTMVAVARFTDHGPGVPEESLSRIFERFYTSDPSRARQKGGTGLGMAIALSVVRAHHGFICATQSDGGGLTFTIVMPLEQPPTGKDALQSA